MKLIIIKLIKNLLGIWSLSLDNLYGGVVVLSLLLCFARKKGRFSFLKKIGIFFFCKSLLGCSSPRPLTLCHQLPFLLGVDSVCTGVPASYISHKTTTHWNGYYQYIFVRKPKKIFQMISLKRL